jgi:hypothetical protein
MAYGDIILRMPLAFYAMIQLLLKRYELDRFFMPVVRVLIFFSRAGYHIIRDSFKQVCFSFNFFA